MISFSVQDAITAVLTLCIYRKPLKVFFAGSFYLDCKALSGKFVICNFWLYELGLKLMIIFIIK